MAKKSLPTVKDEDAGLGLVTIMDPVLATEYGIPYVHLVVFAIDLDRIHVAVEDVPEAENLWPFGFEVFLTEMHLMGLVDAADETHLRMLEDVIEGILDLPPGEKALGTQLAFAVYDAVERGALPERLRAAFRRWKKKPTALLEGLAPLWERPEVEAGDLAEACLEIPLEPPLAPPTRDALEAMVATFETDAPGPSEDSGA